VTYKQKSDCEGEIMVVLGFISVLISKMYQFINNQLFTCGNINGLSLFGRFYSIVLTTNV